MLNLLKKKGGGALASKLLEQPITIIKRRQAPTGTAFLLAAQAHFVLGSFPLKSKVETSD